MFDRLALPIGVRQLARRTFNEVLADNCLGLAAQLGFYFFLALFPALLVLVAIMSYMPIDNLIDTVTTTLARVAPTEVLTIVQDQIIKIAGDDGGGLLTIGMLGAIWSTSSGVTAIIDTLNQAYDIQESRAWWKVKLIALALTLSLALFVVASTALVIGGPEIARWLADRFYLGSVFTWAWLILQWPVVFALVSLGIAFVYYFAPDARQDWIWITPGSVFATTLWLIVSLAFRFYVTNFGSYNATYGTIGGVIVVLLWFYLSGLAILVGAELNAEIEHASPYGKDPGERAPGEKKEIGALAERTWQQAHAAGTFKPALGVANCTVDGTPAPANSDQGTRASDWILSGIVLGEFAVLAYAKLRRRLRKAVS